MKHQVELRSSERRRFVQLLGLGFAPLPGACTDEPLLGLGTDASVARDVSPYQGFVKAYFGPEALASAALVGQFRASARDLDATGAFESTAALRAEIDASVSEADAIDRIEQRIQTDFEALRVADVEGWTFADSEAELCVLALLVVDLVASD